MTDPRIKFIGASETAADFVALARADIPGIGLHCME